MPPLPDAHCWYVSEWVATKLRWGLVADQGEANAPKVYAEACETTVVHNTSEAPGCQSKQPVLAPSVSEPTSISKPEPESNSGPAS
ncbi:hypothetical protein [Streptomyces sp. NPDC058583]|uniref:hypothetical protein n=1 Tax=unclassified Streptomyces TaxID=2593676 RepID=UPI003651F934